MPRNSSKKEGAPTRQDDAPHTTNQSHQTFYMRGAANTQKGFVVAIKPYAQALVEQKRFLRAHGLDEMPTLEQAIHRLLELEDAVFALAAFTGVRLVEDTRGRWHVVKEVA